VSEESDQKAKEANEKDSGRISYPKTLKHKISNLPKGVMPEENFRICTLFSNAYCTIPN